MNLDHLLDPGEFENLLSILNELIEIPPKDRRTCLNQTIEREIIQPIEQYLECEYQRTNGKGHSGTEATLKFLLSAEDVLSILKENSTLFQEHISAFENAYSDWLNLVGWNSYLRVKPFIEAPKRERLDALSEEMLSLWRKYFSEHGRHPSAKELWTELSENDIVQEIDDGSGDTRQWTIYWKTKSGKERATSFKSFQTRYTTLKKKIKKSAK